MPQIVNFDNKQILEPGGYSRILGGSAPVAALDIYGTVMLIDSGSGKGFGGGSGIAGSLLNGSDSIYEITSRDDAKEFLRGGMLYDLMDYLWSPSNAGGGISKMLYARAATTVAATIVLSFNAGANTLTLAVKNEGTVGNGALTSGVLTKGFGVKMRAGVNNPNKYILDFYSGKFKGNDPNGVPYELSEAILAINNIVDKYASSGEIATFADLVTFAQNDPNFNLYFKFVSSTGSAYSLTGTDLTNLTTIQLFAGGTTAYAVTKVDDILGQVVDVDFDAFLADDFGGVPTNTDQQILDGINKGAMSTVNSKLLAFCTSSLYPLKEMYVGGGNNSSGFSVLTGNNDGSVQIAAFFNDSRAVVAHSGIKAIVSSGVLTDIPYSLYHAALLCGRANGLEPQVSVTYKDLRIKGLTHVLSQKQREQALSAGVTHSKNVAKLGWVVNQGITTLQSNASQIYPDGTSPSIQIMRIFHQINKELMINATARFPGGNLKTVSSVELKAFVEGYLGSRTVQPDKDDLLITWRNVTVAFTNGKWDIKYCATPNAEVTQVFFTGMMLDPNIQA